MVAPLVERTMAMPGDDHTRLSMGRCVLQSMNDLHRCASQYRIQPFRQRQQFRVAVDVAADGQHRCELLQRVKHAHAADVSSMDDPVDTGEQFLDLRIEVTVSIRDHAEEQTLPPFIALDLLVLRPAFLVERQRSLTQIRAPR